MISRVKWFNNSKFYGFIEYKEGQDIFVYYSNIVGTGYKTLDTGDLVSFDLVNTNKGFQGLNVENLKNRKRNTILI